METTIKIKGMSCKHCVRRVADALKSSKGVEHAHVSLHDETATVRFDQNKITPDNLIRVVQQTGYNAEK